MFKNEYNLTFLKCRWLMPFNSESIRCPIKLWLQYPKPPPTSSNKLYKTNAWHHFVNCRCSSASWAENFQFYDVIFLFAIASISSSAIWKHTCIGANYKSVFYEWNICLLTIHLYQNFLKAIIHINFSNWILFFFYRTTGSKLRPILWKNMMIKSTLCICIIYSYRWKRKRFYVISTHMLRNTK